MDHSEADSLTGLASVIGRQVRSLDKPRTVGVATCSKQPAAERTAASGAPKDVAALVARRVQSIDPDDPDRPRKAFRVYLESVLLAEFGEHLVNDAGFHQLVDSVHSEMDGDPELARAIHEAATVMLAGAPPASRA